MILRRLRGAVEHSRFGGSGWALVVALVVVLGCVGSVFAARAVARGDERKSQRAFAASSADVASTLKLAIEHENDLVVSASAFIITNPTVSNAVFNRWVRADRAFARYPEILGLVRIVVVPASQLPAFAARAAKNPAGALGADGSFQVIPVGKRPFYCFIDLAGKSAFASATPAGLDLCTGAPGARILAARDSGQGAYQPYETGDLTLLGIQVPIYRGGATPTTVPARRAAFIGWVAVALLPKVVLETAREAHPGTAVTLRYVHGSSPIAFSSGKVPSNAQSLTTDLHNGWTVHTSEAVTGSGVFSSRSALGLLIAGTGVSVLLGLLGAELATGRTRARRLVREQTVELHDQAAELRATVAELVAAQAVKDEFLALVSHELRTPMTSITGYTELLKDEELTDQQQDYLKVIDRNSDRLLSLVEDLLLMTQIQSGGLPLQLGEVILSDLIARSSEAARPFAASKGIDLEIESEPGIATQGDHERLGQVLDNIVSNAIKYTPEGGDVTITMTHTADTAMIAVTDTGIGIPKGEQDQVFSRFFRTSNARGSGIEGTGLGLAITRGIIEAHGGTIGFDSIEGTGTTFLITLPLAHGAGLELAA
jgi:signal transduction histidine kinase